MFSKVKEIIIGNNTGEFHKDAYKYLEKDEKAKQKMIGGNSGEIHKSAYQNLFMSE
jgi:hypothetical protein